jgi:hypothetical protein
MVEIIPMKAQPAELQPAVYHQDDGNNLNLLHLVGGPPRTESGTTPPGTPGRTEGPPPPGSPPGSPPGRGEGGGSTTTDTNTNTNTNTAQAGADATASNGGNALSLKQQMFYAPPAVSMDSGHPVCGGHNIGFSTPFGGIGFGNSKPDDRCWKFMEATQKQHLVDLACSAGINMAQLAHDGYIKVADLAAQIVQRNPAARSEVQAMGALTTTEAIQSADLMKLCRDSLVQGLGGNTTQTVIGNISLDQLPPAPPPAPPRQELPAPPRPAYHPRPVQHPKPQVPCETEDKVVKVCKIPHKPAGS